MVRVVDLLQDYELGISEILRPGSFWQEGIRAGDPRAVSDIVRKHILVHTHSKQFQGVCRWK